MATSKTQAKAALEILKNFAMENTVKGAKIAKNKATDAYKTIKEKYNAEKEKPAMSVTEYLNELAHNEKVESVSSTIKDGLANAKDSLKSLRLNNSQPLEFEITKKYVPFETELDLSDYKWATKTNEKEFNSYLLILTKDNETQVNDHMFVALVIMDNMFIAKDDQTKTALLEKFGNVYNFTTQGYQEIADQIANFIKETGIIAYISLKNHEPEPVTELIDDSQEANDTTSNDENKHTDDLKKAADIFGVCVSKPDVDPDTLAKMPKLSEKDAKTLSDFLNSIKDNNK